MYNPQYPPPPRRKSNVWAFIGIGVALLLLCIIGSLIIGIFSPSTTKDSGLQAPASEAAEAARELGSAVPARSSAPAAPKAAAKKTIGDGLWKVGRDLPPGKYIPTKNVKEVSGVMGCYWVKASDAEMSDVAGSGMVENGRPEITLSKGQWFTTNGCGTWQEQ